MSSRTNRIIGLIVTPVLVLAGLAVSGHLRPFLEPDSGGYLEFDWSSPATVLNGVRTAGYPAFLKLAAAFGGGASAVPTLHWLAATLAAWLMYWGLNRTGFRSCVAFWCAIVLMFNREMLDFGNSVMADSLATSLAVASTACFFAIMPQRTSILGWIGLMVFTFLTYQVRPAYIFLIPFWPLMTVFLDVFLFRRFAPWGTIVKRSVLVTSLIVIPFVGYCTVRWFVVGHWGLVSFGGYNIVGIAGQFLDQPLAEQLPESIRPFALKIVERREQRGDVPTPTNYESLELGYNTTVWEIVVPTAREFHGDNVIALNRDLTKLSREILIRRFPAYVRSLIWNGKHAFSEILQLTFRDRGTLLVLLIAGLVHARSLLRPRAAQPQKSRSLCEVDDRIDIEVHLLFWTALGFAAAKSLLVILVEPSIGRYMTAAMALIPCAIAAIVAQYLCPADSECTRTT